MSNSIEKIYDLKRDFSLLALTGLEGAGCSFLAELMSLKKEDYIKSKRLRSPNSFSINKMVDSVNNDDHFKNNTNNNDVVNQLVFHKKYSICYNYFKEYYQPYVIIKYSKVCWLYTLLFLREKAGSNESFTIDYLKDSLKLIFEDKYVSSKSCPEGDKEYCGYKPNLNSIEIEKLINGFEYSGLIEEINDKYSKNFRKPRGTNAKKLAKFFFDDKSAFSEWSKSVTGTITKTDYYRTCYFYHRFATVLRTFGNPLESSDKLNDATNHDFIFCIVDMINGLLKGMKKDSGTCQRRFVIDSIRNSTELAYLKERYNAFYVIAVSCSDVERNDFIVKKLIYAGKDGKRLKRKDREKIELTRNAIRWITDIEADKKDHDNGKLAFPDTELCFADAEIHITNSENNPQKDDFCFSSIEEQWMKYASLLLHPGLITPSPEERCMAVAYTARLNSSCVSRQVGAVITNKYHAIRTIGWNDVPYGQVACGLRDLRDHFKIKADQYSVEEQMMYSEFERSGGLTRYDKCFRDCVREDFTSSISKADLKGYPAPYCFRTLDNRYTGEVNQTQTRSLHAEENAMLQMVKYGGEPLKDGIIYVTDSPCELCSKKLYQIGVRRIVFIDIYPGIANENITRNGLKQPELIQYRGAYGSSYIKLFRPVISQKDELTIRTGKNSVSSSKVLLKDILEKLGKTVQKHYSEDDVKDILSEIPDKKRK